ncbi:drug/metabolite transporter (DMT)-like permease [Clostridium acetobutylicum]|uniref:Predicted permease n=1 Tax=Clostridium acetobutylicum (strain ATCC 824 / DSM 792 / JCM 1419 / IAM 19013 / LMG 5710 / NBRC 13948 / NRRL B-527 / VKM B-1787 / 2291 / W) TaxID=272562 RepID=Q97K74_CLOAB|nr:MULTISPECIES: DMT family transporter [Clostridium]AAK79021.1 Predicted permease [Clostridium acetobutylicum ATCC 824]ADZ20096.1 permease [Clostridium acetobutylicum EA 2018]AEI31576.1 permease [Clostridium acetobutylicum DSM 1731]AWV81723.1 EamA family transporter [Clostridium acetobutylicum]MBC2395265.1 EamA family transporter [Clostridium acetobutylicum]
MKKGYMYIALTTIIFSTMEIALKLVSKSFNPIQLNFTRFFIGGLFLVPFALNTLHKRHLSISTKDLRFFALLGLLGTVISMSLYQLAVQNTKASVVAVLFSCNPVFVTILAFFLLREAIHKNNIAALILEVIGTIVIIDPLNTKLSILGLALTIASTLIFAAYGVFGKKKCAKYGGIVVTCFGFLFGSIEMLVLIGITHITPIANLFSSNGIAIFSNIPLFTGYSLKNLPLMCFICLINTGAGFACYFKAMEETSAQTTSLVFFFKPILAPILALILLHEIIPVNMIIGILFILAGSISSILPELLAQRQTKLEKTA